MSIELAGGASTQSRARRPLPAGAVRGVTLSGHATSETVEFEYLNGRSERKMLLSWVTGQAGLLWGHGPFPFYPFIDDGLDDVSVSGSYGHQNEHELAEALGVVYDGLLSSLDMSIRFFQNGGDACSAAARVCRAVTGRDHILSYGYHGAHLDFAHYPTIAGVPRELRPYHVHFSGEWLSFSPNDELITKRKYACIVLEVPPAEDDEMRQWLQSWREYCDRTGTPLVIDDVVLGFRIALGGSAEYYGVKPDIVILGKAMSATGCVSAVLGRKDLVGRLADDVFYSTTFGGTPGPCAVAAATVNWLVENRDEVYGETGKNERGVILWTKGGHLHRIGQALKDGLNKIGIKVIGQPERSVAVFDSEEARRAWCSRMIEQGVIADRPFFPTLAHTIDDVTKTIEAAKAIA
jgi:glutamate-1-semialdehyde 2,1-aminomutase